MLSNLLVNFWLFAYGRHRIRGTAFPLRYFHRWLPGLRAYYLDVPGAGRVRLDFSDGTAFGMLLRLKLGDLDNDYGLYRSIEYFLHPGAVLWDVGAFVGYLSGYFAHPRFKLGAIHSFEPNPVNIAHLRELFGTGGLTTVHPFALGAKDESLNLSVQSQNSSTASLVHECAGGALVPIQVRHGDSMREELGLPLPDVIKIDVEGFEPSVIEGLRETIEKKRPVIFFEHIFLSDKQVNDMVPAGYSLFFIEDDGRITDTPESRKTGHDAFMVPAEKVEAAKALMTSALPSSRFINNPSHT